MNFLEILNQFLVQRAEAERADNFRKWSTESLKAAWDAFNPDAEPGEKGYFWPADGPHVEDVHRILNERGEGEYCAV